MLFNKYITFTISTIGVLAALVPTLNLESVMDVHTAGAVATVCGAIRMLTALLAPAANAQVDPTGGKVVTHN